MSMLRSRQIGAPIQSQPASQPQSQPARQGTHWGKWLLFLLAFGAVGLGLIVFTGSRSVLHEIAGLVLWLCGAVFLSAGVVIEAIERKRIILTIRR
jgi:drug/metabolite transporter (DMT)-like permease